jgi:hypothetical protein
MSASLLSSFFVFVLTGIVAFLDLYGGLTFFGRFLGGTSEISAVESSWLTSVNDFRIEAMIFLAVLANAIYFYYFAAMCEMDKEYSARLKNSSVIEWWIRVFNSFLFLCIWYVLKISATLFIGYMVLLYCTFFLWDFVTYKHVHADIKGEVRKSLINADFFGFILVLFLGLALHLINNSAPSDREFPMLLLGGVLFGMIANCVSAIMFAKKENKFNPFAKEYRKRGNLQ